MYMCLPVTTNSNISFNFSVQLGQATGLDDFKDELFYYFESRMAQHIIDLQATTSATDSDIMGSLDALLVNSLDGIRREIVNCCAGLDLPEVCRLILLP